MDSRNFLPDFVDMGQRLYKLANHPYDDDLLCEIQKLIDDLKKCDLLDTLSTAHALSNIRKIERDQFGKPSMAGLAAIRGLVRATNSSLYHEIRKRILIEIDTSGVLPELSQFQRFNESQEKLREETIVCIERGAFRAAIVMGWNLAYDYIRQWMFDNHLVQFNSCLLSGYLKKKGDSQFTEIKEYEDFFTGKPSEYVVIDTCEAANLWGAKLSRKLHYYLNRRNDFAHPSGLAPSREQANEYIKNLLDLLSDRPFNASNSVTSEVE